MGGEVRIDTGSRAVERQRVVLEVICEHSFERIGQLCAPGAGMKNCYAVAQLGLDH